MNKLFTLFIVLLSTVLLPTNLKAQFTQLKTLVPLEARDFATSEKQQAKVFVMDGQYWAILANESGTHLWLLQDNEWRHELKLVTKNSRADYAIIENVVHIVLYSGPSSQFVSIEYDNTLKKFKPWNKNKATIDLFLDEGVETASVDADKSGRLWVASSGSDGKVNVRWSDSPYTNWSSPITLAEEVLSDDICAVVSLPMFNQVGVLWSNQRTKRWGFKTHRVGDDPQVWSKDETPASQSALSQGSGMSDDHINIKVASDGTMYCAVKTGYDKAGYPLIALLVRRPNGTWDNLYEVSQTGTLPIVILDEEQGLIKVLYSSATYGGDILYKESSTSKISFCKTHTLISGKYNYVASTKGNYRGETVILASSETHVVGVLAVDDASSRDPLPNDCSDDDDAFFVAYPNPFMQQTTVNFKFLNDQNYTLTLYDGNGARLGKVNSAKASAGELNTVIVDASRLSRGLYLLKLETSNKVKTLKLIYER